MRDKVVLAQAYKFKIAQPLTSHVKRFIEKAREYERENEVYFLEVKYNQKPKITNYEIFFEFVSFVAGVGISSFEELGVSLEKSTSRKQSIEKSGNSKEFYTKVFNKTILFQIKDQNPVLYRKSEDVPCENSKKIVAVENGEVFLGIRAIFPECEQFIYLGGYANSATREFLKDKDVIFFLD